MESWSIDTIDPLSSDERKPIHYRIIDKFSRFIELYSVPDIGADIASKVLLSHIGRYGASDEIFSDSGTQYVNRIITELMKLVCLEHV